MSQILILTHPSKNMALKAIGSFVSFYASVFKHICKTQAYRELSFCRVWNKCKFFKIQTQFLSASLFQLVN